MKKLLNALFSHPYLIAVRNGLTLTFPVVMAGSLAVMLNNLPIQGYQSMMANLWGEGWRSFGGHVWNGTFAVMSFFMIYTISHSIGERHNHDYPLLSVSPSVVALVSFASLMVLFQPASETFAIPYIWAGIHGLFLAILVGLAASIFFLRLLRVQALRISFYSESADTSIPHAFNSLFPGLITVLCFAALKTASVWAGVPDIHLAVYDLLRRPFDNMGNTFFTSVVYNFLRHFFWFWGLHGSNILEPVTESLYTTAMNANAAAHAAGLEPPFIFTRTFFDVFISMGGAGATLSMIIAGMFCSKRSSFGKISRLSLFPAIFNINEMMIFGIPIVLNPVFFIPFIGTPLVLSAVSWFTMWFGFVPYTIQEVAWTTPVLLSGYAATGSAAGSILQAVNVAIGVALYYPFIKIAEQEKDNRFEKTFAKLISLSDDVAIATRSTLTGRLDEAGALARSLVGDLEEALIQTTLRRNAPLYLEYQPQVNCYTGKVTGVEALIRWRHPRIGYVPPPVIVTLAEDAGLIKKIGMWTFSEACRQLREWRDRRLADITMSVNFSVCQLDDTNLPDQIMAVLAEHSIPPSSVEIEVTESVALPVGSVYNELLMEVHACGIKLAIDDFGMGHSSLVYLKQFPVNTLKVDKVLSKDVLTKDGSAEIIATIADLCRSRGISMLVEYVETEEQLQKLKSLGAVNIQGYFFSCPLPPDECLAFIQKGAN